MNTRRHALAIAISLAFASAYSQETNDKSGKRIDNARVDFHPVPAPAEVQSDFAWPLPSGITRSDVQSMRAAVASLPAAAPDARKTIDERSSGALFDSGKADLTAEWRRSLDALINEIKGRPGLRIAVVGHTDNQRLAPETKRLFGTNQGLSEARSVAVANYLRQALDLAPAQIAIEGDGDSKPVTDNATPQGMARNRRVELRVWFDVPPALARPAPRPASVAKAACAPEVGSSLAHGDDSPFRVTIDGEPMATDGKPVEADRQRCTDVALEKADIQVRYDGLAIAPAMNAWATPNAVVSGEKVEFRAWSNYIPWIRKAELRLFHTGQQPQETPFMVLPVDWNKPLTITAPSMASEGQVFYLLRVYDDKGRFDETSLKPLTLLAHAKPFGDADNAEREKLTGYGENSLALRNIPVAGGTVTVNGTHLKPGQKIEALGLDLPVDAQGKFAIKQIMPSGPHPVEVRVSNTDGSSVGFRRNLTIPTDDWFYIALGDLTVGHNAVTGPASLVTGDTTHYDDKAYVDGRGAFYLKGKIKGEYLLTAAADTREGPLRDVFSNFSTKDPKYLLREVNPDLYYPVYGDDSTTVDDAPTQGKFYVRLEKGDSHVMWGNFKTAWTGTELIQYSRGLYGAKLRYRSDDMTQYGEKKLQVDGFAADPGTISSRDEYRGTGGSLYYLRNLDITQGSEMVWIEARDRDSGLVVERRQLSPVQDYELNNLQGRIILRDPLSSTGGGGGLIMTSAVNGNPLYLVVTYEYAPGVTAISNFSSGGRASFWVNDHVQVGVTGYHQGQSGADQTLKGVDTILRYKPGTYVKFETAHSSGIGDGALVSQDGGFGFNALAASGQDASAHSIAVAVDLAEVTDQYKGKLSAWSLHRDQGFSAPGQINITGTAARQDGLKAEVQVAAGTTLEAKADKHDADLQNNKSAEVAVRQQLNDEWQVAAGLRRDERQTPIPNASAILSQNGGRTDSQLRFDFKPNKEGGKPGEKDDWDAYGFVQGTLEHDGNRDLNNRGGLGGSWRVNDRVKLLAEGSDGNLGVGGKVGIDYRLSDRSNAYANYQLETDDPNATWRGSQGTWVSGATTRLTDQLRTFGETRATNGAGPQSLTQAFGMDWAPNDRWNYGGKAEFGTVSDPLAGDLTRRAVGLSAGYKQGGVKYGGGLEFRRDLSTLSGERTTWLLRNSLGVQATKAWRLLGKLNYSRSDNTQGAFVDGNYHEVVTGAAYRPVDNDRWNTLFKYTNLYNVPSAGQVAASGSAATYSQKSQVFSVDTIYDVRPWISVGIKYAFRVGQLQDNSVPGSDWFSSRADLVVLRADWHWVKEWDAMLELRKLRATEAADARAGTLVAVYRHMAEGVKAGVGYNFTTYSDDLTNLSYRSRGWFFNMLLSM
jgi:outer membrane protein OmpA-like peptidoglycan-associated protein